MALETGQYLSDLVVTNPAHTDSLNETDSHLRLIKSVLKNTFGNVDRAIVTLNDDDEPIFQLSNGSASNPGLAFASKPSVGLWLGATGIMRGSGLVPCGSLHMFPRLPVETGLLGTSDTSTVYQYLEMNGATYPASRYPELAAFFGVSSGNFTLPNYSQYFMRGRSGGQAVGVTQTDSIRPHTHDISGVTNNENVSHTHLFSGQTATMSGNATHTHAYWQPRNTGINASINNTGAPAPLYDMVASTVEVSGTNHTHSFSGTTGTASTTHVHAFSGTTDSGNGMGTETRPLNVAVILAIKT